MKGSEEHLWVMLGRGYWTLQSSSQPTVDQWRSRAKGIKVLKIIIKWESHYQRSVKYWEHRAARPCDPWKYMWFLDIKSTFHYLSGVTVAVGWNRDWTHNGLSSKQDQPDLESNATLLKGRSHHWDNQGSDQNGRMSCLGQELYIYQPLWEGISLSEWVGEESQKLHLLILLPYHANT